MRYHPGEATAAVADEIELMPMANFALTVTLGSLLAMSPPTLADDWTSALTQEPAPTAQPQPAPQPAQEPATGPGQTYPVPWTDPNAAPPPQPAPAPAPQPPPPADERTGVGMLVAGPLVIAAGVPFSFLGNAAWRDNCGPNSSNSQCADGTAAAVGAHIITGFAYGTGIALTGVGARRLGEYNGRRHPGDGSGFIVGGAVLLPGSLIGMGMVRLFLWLPTPDCQEYGCVQRYQTISTATVGGLALAASLGAGLLMYGAGYNKFKNRGPMALLPNVGRGYAGLSLTGKF